MSNVDNVDVTRHGDDLEECGSGFIAGSGRRYVCGRSAGHSGGHALAEPAPAPSQISAEEALRQVRVALGLTVPVRPETVVIAAKAVREVADAQEREAAEVREQARLPHPAWEAATVPRWMVGEQRLDAESTVATLACYLPGGTNTPPIPPTVPGWDARQVAEFQAERLARAGYALVQTGAS